MNCGNPKCDHPYENHIGIDGTPNSICNADIFCDCGQFEEQFLHAFAAEIEVIKAKRWSIYERVEHILKTIPQTRNAGEKTFYKIYIEIWHGFKIRVKDTSLTKEQWDRLPNQDTINREKRRCKQLNGSLATYDGTVLKHQAAIFQALMDMSAVV